MELYDYMKNIKRVNREEIIKECIINSKKNLNGLTNERMCKVYSSSVFQELNKKGIGARIINTVDLGFDYEHHFVLVNDIDKYYLIDLTFSQFLINDNMFNELNSCGYIMVNDELLNRYLSFINKNSVSNYLLDNIYYGDNSKKR